MGEFLTEMNAAASKSRPGVRTALGRPASYTGPPFQNLINFHNILIDSIYGMAEYPQMTADELESLCLEMARERMCPIMVSCLISLRKKSQPIGSLARLVRVSTASITGRIDRMERMEYAVRIKDDRDRRVVLVYITEKGESFLRKLETKIKMQ